MKKSISRSMTSVMLAIVLCFGLMIPPGVSFAAEDTSESSDGSTAALVQENSSTIGELDDGVVPADGLISFRDYIINMLNDAGYTFNGAPIQSSISDDDLGGIVAEANSPENGALFDRVEIPANTISDIDYLPKLQRASNKKYIDAGTTVKLPEEFTYERIHEVYDAYSAPDNDFGSNHEVEIAAPVYEIDNVYFDTIGIYFCPMAEPIHKPNPLCFIDAIPGTFYLESWFIQHSSEHQPLPVVHPSTTYTSPSGVSGYRDPTTEQGVTIDRTLNASVSENKVAIADDFDCSLISQSAPFTIQTNYAIATYMTIGADGVKAQKGILAYRLRNAIDVKYSVSLEPITAGALTGTPVLSGYETSVKAEYPTKSQHPGEPDPGRVLPNTPANINRGMNSATDSIGSNAGGVDIRGIDNGDGSFSAGSSTAPDASASETMQLGGTRSTGFAKYGAKNLTVDGNADTANGYEVDYYEAEVFHPVTNESLGWVQADGTMGSTKAKLSQDQMDGYLSGTGISGKTKIYVAYKSKNSFTKTDNNTPANALTSSLVGAQNLPSFVLYSDAACTQYAVDPDHSGEATKEENTFAYDQTTGEVTSPYIPDLLMGDTSPKTYYMKETAPGFVQDGNIYKVEIDSDGVVSFDTAGGFLKDGEKYSLPNTPLPVNLKLQTSKTLDGSVEHLQDDEFKFLLTQTGTPEGVAPLIPASGVEALSKADGSIDFGTTLSFSVPGTYTFLVSEDATYRNTGIPDEFYDTIDFDTTPKTITVVVAWENKSLQATVYVKKGNEGQKKVATLTGLDTNIVNADGTVAAKPSDVAVGAFANHSKKPTAKLSGTKTLDLGTLADDQFTFSLVPDQTYADVTYYDSSNAEQPLPTGGWTSIPNKADGSIDFASVFSSLAFPERAGEYHFTLTENDIPNGSSYSKDDKSVPIVITVAENKDEGRFMATVSYDGATTPPTFDNTFKRTSLVASKTVATGGSQSDEFEFTLTFNSGTTGLTLPVTGLELGTGNSATITQVNGAAATTVASTDSVSSITYKVKHGQQLALAGVPVGLGYTLHETPNAGYFDNTDRTGTVASSGATITMSNQVKTGDVYISKSVTGLHSSDEDAFDFTMKIEINPAYTWVEHSYNISQDGGVTWGPKVDVSATAASISFQLKDGWVARVNKLPIGTYTVNEAANDTYTATPASQKIELDATNVDDGARTEFTNTKNAPTPAEVVLAATKTVDGDVPTEVITGYNGTDYTTVPFSGAFSFDLSSVGALPAGASAPTNATQAGVLNSATGAVTFDKIGNLDAEGDYTFRIAEATPDTEYIDAVGSAYKAVVHVAYNAKANENRDYKGDSVTTPNCLYVSSITWTKDGAAATEAKFDNKQKKPEPTTASFEVTKTLDGATPAAGAFDFTVTAADGTPMPTNTTASNLADGSVDFGDIKFEAAGTYTYTITENDPSAATVVKDSRTYEVVITVKDNGTGTNSLVATTTYTASAATDSTGAASATDKAAFVNLTKAEASIPVSKTVTYGNGVTSVATMPTFTYTLATQSGAPMPAAGGETCTTTGAGSASFGTISYGAIGTYSYTVTETAPNPLPTGWTYDSSTYDVTVTVTYAGGHLVATPAFSKDGTPVTANEFVNDYSPIASPAQASPTVSKAVDGPVPAEAKPFSFTIAEGAGNPSTGLLGMSATTQASTAATGNFGSATFDKAGTYTFTITEDDLSAATFPGYTKDTSVYTWTVVVGDNEGQLAVTSSTLSKDGAPASSVLFANAYNTTPTPAQASPDIDKTLTGAWADAASLPSFSFSLAPDASNPANGCTGLTNQATIVATDFSGGQASLAKAFGDATFSKAGTYSFTIAEVAGVAAGWKYDTARYTWTVVVEDNDSQLEVASSTITKAGQAANAVSFTNDYTPTPGMYELKVNKAITGGTPVFDSDFTFTLEGLNGAPMPATASATITGAGTASFGQINYSAAGVYRYKISEVSGADNRYTYDTSVFEVTVTVTDNNGSLETTAVATKAGDAAVLDDIVFTNAYNDTPGVPEVEKSGNTSEATAGDEISWNISVSNPEDFDIYGIWVKDLAPQYTTLVSAVGDTEGKVVVDDATQYASWFIPVLKAGEKTSLVLKATVNADVPDGTAVSNTALYEVTGLTIEPPDTSRTPKEPTNKVDTPIKNPSVPSSSSTSADTAAKTGDELPVLPLTVALLTGGAVALIARRRLTD